MLSGMDLDSTTRVIDDTLRLSKCIQIARLYLEDDDAVNAEAFINKASFLVSNSQHEVLNLQYKVCYARILDLKRKFLEAALRYYDISHIEKRQIGDELIDENSFRFLVPLDIPSRLSSHRRPPLPCHHYSFCSIVLAPAAP